MFDQMKKNTVEAVNQLQKQKFVTFEYPDCTGIRVMFLGNSITLHGKKADIGWMNAWGMAASAKEKDYVHRLIAQIRQEDVNATFCICQGSVWERQYKEGNLVHSFYEKARNFEADIIVMRLIENCPPENFQCEVFQKSLEKLLTYLNPTGKAKIILTTGFWRHPGDNVIIKMAKEQGMPVVELGDLGEQEEMKAINLFEHEGVANHPGDLGMEKIAERIYEVLKLYLN